MLHRKRRLVLRIAAGFILSLLVLAVTLPVWFPWVLRPAARSLGVDYDRFERRGYARFELRNVSFELPSGRVEADQVRTFFPVSWLWRLARDVHEEPFLQISGWRYSHTPAASNKVSRGSPGSLFTNVSNVRRTLALLDPWLPHAFLTNGTLDLQTAGKFQVELFSARWREGRFDATAATAQTGSGAITATTHSNRLGLQVVLERLALQGEFEGVLGRETLAVQGEMMWETNRASLTAVFARDGLLPEEAAVQANAFRVAGDRIGMSQYGNVSGSIRGRWRAAGLSATNRAQFEVDVEANAAPEAEGFPPLDLAFHASGTTNFARIETAHLVSPWIRAELSEGTRIAFRPPFVPNPAQLTVLINLAQQRQVPASGRLEGRATLFPGTNRFPRVSFALAGEDVAVSNLVTRTLRTEGELDWPWVRLRDARVVLRDGSEAELQASANLEEKRVEQGTLKVSGAFGRDLLPGGYSFENAMLAAEAAGPISNLNHSGSIRVDGARIPNGRKLDLHGDWNGDGSRIDRFSIEGAAGEARLTMTGGMDAREDIKNVTLREVTLRTTRHGVLSMTNPVPVTFTPAPLAGDSSSGWKLDWQRFRLAGDGHALETEGSIHWPHEGTVRVHATNLTPALMEDFVRITNAPVQVGHFALEARWSNAPVEFSMAAAARFEPENSPGFFLEAAANGGDLGTVVRRFSIGTATQVVCRAQGQLPIVILPSATNDWLQIRNEGALEFHAFTETNSMLWEELAERLPVRLKNPDVRIDVRGTWADPEGVVRATLDQLEARTTRPLPSASRLKFELSLARDEANARFSAAVQEQQVRVTAQMPLGRGFWTTLLRERKVPDLGAVSGTARIENARVASFTEFAPELIAPQGEVTLDLRLNPGNHITGEAVLYNLGTRPIPSLGPLRAIDGRLIFHGTTVSLTNLSAEIGGQRVTVTGSAKWDDRIWREREWPPFDLNVVGTNVPLVRQSSVLLRADLNLAITNQASTNGIISGNVRLRDSFFLSSLRDLASGRVESPRRRPPYFSVEAEPLASWRLGVQVEGDRFLRAQTPLFRGTVSTTMRIEGTLRTPVALGEVRIHSGSVTFPFGSLDVQQGFVSLTSANPYRPQLFVTAESQRMGYDIRMEVSGSADDPVVQFSSTPSLTSEQIVLMLTTGQTPQGVAGAASTRQRAQGVALFVGKNLLSELGIGGGEGRLTIRSGEEMTEAGRPTYDVEYKLSDDWSLVGEYDRFSQYNLGLKWRVYSK